MFQPLGNACLLLLLPALVTGQEPAAIDITPRWRAGDAVDVELVKETVDVVGGVEVPEHRRTTRVRLDVVRQEKTGWELAWTYGATKVEPQTTLVSALANIHRGLRLRIHTDAGGRPVRLGNPDAVLAFYSRMRKKAADDLLAKGMRPAALERVFADLDRVMTPGSIEIVVLRDPRLFLSPLGVSLAVGGQLPLLRMEPNALGGDPIPSRGVMQLSAHDAKAGEARLSWKLKLDEKKAAPIFLKSLRAIAKKAGQPEPGPDDLPRIEIVKLGTAIVDLTKGWPKELRRMVTTTQGKRSRIESATMKVVARRREGVEKKG